MTKNRVRSSIVLVILGVGLYSLITWKWNVAAAAWLAPIFLVRHFRTERRWVTTLPAALLLWVASYANKSGAWGMDAWMEVAAFGIAAVPMIAALYVDRFTSRRLPSFPATLVFPCTYVVLDYAVSFLPFGTVFSPGPSQFYLEPLIQIASLTGVWGIVFIVLWAAPVINGWWENGWRVDPVRAPLAGYAFCLAAVLLVGGLRLVFTRPEVPTVRVAGVAVAHARNYWEDLIDIGTPESDALALTGEMQALTDELFAESETAVDDGANVIFWSEANAFVLPDQRDAFMQRAAAFARQHQVYFMPAYQILRYGDTSGFNGLALFTPEGDLAYEYEKTLSWYATTSDGVIHSLQTPYGRIGAVICFDLDFPAHIRQAARQGVDIMLVPAFDTYQTRVYHTEVGLLRGVEGGFSVARMVNEGTSIAVDYRGHVLASQDFFTTPRRVMIVDLPTRGRWTLYGAAGDWFAWVCAAAVVALIASAARRRAADPQHGVHPA